MQQQSIISDKSIVLDIKSPETTVFQGEVESLSSINEIGPFDILPLHANFISILKEKVIYIKNGQKQEIKIDNGILKVVGNKVKVFLGIQTIQEEIVPTLNPNNQVK